MNYPPEFPAPSRARVEAEKIRAGRDFDAAKSEVRWASDVEGLLRTYILRVFLAFANEARDQHVWPVDRMDAECREFLRRMTVDAYYEKGKGLPAMISNWCGGIISDVQRAFEKSDLWKQYEEGLLQVADHQAAQSPEEIAEEAATRLLEAQPGFAAAQVWMRERMAELEEEAGPDGDRFNTAERAELALKLFDVRAEAFSRIVTSIETQNAFMTVLQYLVRVAVQEYSGYDLKHFRPLDSEADPVLSEVPQKVKAWTLEGYRRVVEAEERTNGNGAHAEAGAEMKADAATYPNRAAWLKSEMARRGNHSAYRLRELGGPDA